MGDEQRGLYRKYKVTRTDGSSKRGGKHERCSYFVLDINHDEFAIPALKAYARACRRDYPQLAESIDAVVDSAPVNCGCREAMCPHVGIDDPGSMAARLMRERGDNGK